MKTCIQASDGLRLALLLLAITASGCHQSKTGHCENPEPRDIAWSGGVVFVRVSNESFSQHLSRLMVHGPTLLRDLFVPVIESPGNTYDWGYQGDLPGALASLCTSTGRWPVRDNAKIEFSADQCTIFVADGIFAFVRDKSPTMAELVLCTEPQVGAQVQDIEVTSPSGAVVPLGEQRRQGQMWIAAFGVTTSELSLCKIVVRCERIRTEIDFALDLRPGAEIFDSTGSLVARVESIAPDGTIATFEPRIRANRRYLKDEMGRRFNSESHSHRELPNGKLVSANFAMFDSARSLKGVKYMLRMEGDVEERVLTLRPVW